MISVFNEVLFQNNYTKETRKNRQISADPPFDYTKY